ncbi:saccharopine dehydrogenase-like oxidoreductase [Athalia rosae]|uniref:saccharopine dehydrogenase-like oxidoreductase n=1 Tax=Athalia rosae TaxID=37344 RepID=UPI0020336045|nr:saccharopine dehydrogenase-like oxidoreductase [Athalia rosae]XP_048512832.1 saccharopine dehydrogenase-like oxidoreductase [Athalia rosae]XP_048512833.1 saccharopine dehydrogenase-like oxidoreductase [Athalia rosae]
MAAERLDVIIFGATGFTGKYTIEEAVKLSQEKQFTWGIAGRRKEALEAVLKEHAPNRDDIPILIADASDLESLKKMTERAKVVVNCCGPYRFYGEPVIQACIDTRTHHVDVSGEPQFMERMQVEYGQKAKDAGVYIVSACGFDSIPCDLGIIFLQNKFNGEVNSVETYLSSWKTSNVGGAGMHYGTWETVIHEISHRNELRGLRSKLFPEKLPNLTPKLVPRGLAHKSSISEGWSTKFPGADKSTALRTQYFLFQNYKQRPAQVQTYITFKSIFALFATAIVGVMVTLMTKFECGKQLLLKHPKFFTAGFVSHEGPKPEAMNNTHFAITFKATGWTEALAEPTDAHTGPPNKEMITKVTGVNPGYGATCTAVMTAALTILKEADKMPDNGGVLPPGAAFGKTSIIEELNKHGLKFEVISSIEK